MADKRLRLSLPLGRNESTKTNPLHQYTFVVNVLDPRGNILMFILHLHHFSEHSGLSR